MPMRHGRPHDPRMAWDHDDELDDTFRVMLWRGLILVLIVGGLVAHSVWRG